MNDDFSTTERATLYAMGHFVWSAIFLLRCYRSGGPVSFTLSDGSVLEGCVHPDWISTKTGLKVTAMDLKSAYKQLRLSPLDYNKAVVSLWSPRDNDIACFECRVLPIGASASVHNFLRVSAFLQAAGCALGILWSSYFDDFPMLSHALHVGSTLTCAKTLTTLFRFLYSEEKLLPFDDRAEILGVVLDLGESGNGRISVTNKPLRVNDLSVAIDHLVSRRAVVPLHMPSVLGKLRYADSHVWGRAGRLAMADLREIGHTGRSEVSLDDLQIKALEVLKERLCSGRPKTLIADDVQRRTWIFTDGALEYEGNDPVATIGGLLIGPAGICEVFGASVPDDVMRLWQSDGKVHVIGLVECMLVLYITFTLEAFSCLSTCRDVR